MEVVNSFTLLSLVIGALTFFHQFFFSSLFLLSSLIDDPSINNISELIGTHDLCENSEINRVDRDIFFLETSGEECLSVRQACSVESASRTNPGARILVRMEANGPILGEFYSKWKSERKGLAGYDRSCSITDALLKEHANIQVIKEGLLSHLRDTPLEALLSNKEHGILQSQFPLAQRSDLVRVALLWKFGGIYLDLDVVVLRPLYCLKDAIGLKDWNLEGKPVLNWVESGVMTFEASHPFIKYLMHYFVEEYKPDNYFSLGPPTLSSALLDFCETDELPDSKVGGSLRCWNDSRIEFNPTSAFYVLDNKERDVFFGEKFELNDVEMLKKSYLSHIYHSKNGIHTLPGSLYGKLAQSYCPVTYHMALEQFGQF